MYTYADITIYLFWCAPVHILHTHTHTHTHKNTKHTHIHTRTHTVNRHTYTQHLHVHNTNPAHNTKINLHVDTHTYTHAQPHLETLTNTTTRVNTHFIFENICVLKQYAKCYKCVKKHKLLYKMWLNYVFYFIPVNFVCVVTPSFASVQREEVDTERHCTC